MTTFKDTLTLPQTNFPQWVEQPSFEKEELQCGSHLVKPASLTRGNYHLHGGPPFANGSLHFGHFLNVALKDMVVRSKLLAGYNARLSLGWDCHGLPLEQAVTKEDPTLRADPTRLRSACQVKANEFVALQRTQLNELALCHELREAYLTMSPDYEAGQLEVLARFQSAGLFYTAHRPTLWSYGCQTALAEAEVEYQDQATTSAYVRFPCSLGCDLLVWTTQPWTLLANEGVAYNPGLTYKRYGNLVMACGTADGTGEGTNVDLTDVTYTAPYSDQVKRLYPASYVSGQEGTGLVHLAPAHGPEDYQLGKQYGLSLAHHVTPKGQFDENTQLVSVRGLNVFAANPKILEDLQARGLLEKTMAMTHRYPYCWRSKTPLLYRATQQWFVSLDELKKAAREQSGKVKFYPPAAQNRLESALENRPDWCVSRQRAWGLPLPVFYHSDGTAYQSAELTRKVAKLFAEKGSQSWFTLNQEELTTLLGVPGQLTRGTDTMDVWLDSGSSCHTVLRGEQADLYLEGSDQHRGWFQSSLCVSTALYGQAPYKNVYTHGFVLEPSRMKFSKSKGSNSATGFVATHGVEVMRLWVAAQNTQEDVVFDERTLKQSQEVLRTFRNSLRAMLGNMGEKPGAEDYSPLTLAYLAALTQLQNQVLQDYEGLNFHTAVARLLTFCKHDFSARFFDAAKDSLYCDSAQQSSEVRQALRQTFVVLSSLLWPLVPLTVMSALREARMELLTLHTAPVNERDLNAWRTLCQLKDQVNLASEPLRQQGLGKPATLQASVPDKQLLDALGTQVATLLGLSKVEYGAALTVSAHPGNQCPRCWKYYGEECLPEPPLCPRCKTVVSAKT